MQSLISKLSSLIYFLPQGEVRLFIPLPHRFIEGIDISEWCVRWGVATTRQDKIWIGFCSLKQFERSLAHLLRCGILEEAHWVEVAHGWYVCRYTLDGLYHVYLVAEMQPNLS